MKDPNVPTYSESGIKGVELASVWGLLAPAGTPKAIVDRWNTEVNAVLKQPNVRDKIIATGADLIGGSPKSLGDMNTAERARLAPVVREAGIKLD